MGKKVWIGKRGESPSKIFLFLKYGLVLTIALNMIYETVLSYYICGFLKDDLAGYKHQDEVWIREFYKTSKNFFVFTVILMILVSALGIVSVYNNSRLLVPLYLFGFLLEWGFELIGIYCSNDWNVIFYKILCEVGRPLIFILGPAFAYLISDYYQGDIVIA